MSVGYPGRPTWAMGPDELWPLVLTECRKMPTRTCPVGYGDGGCDDHPCARFESNDETPWKESP